MNDYCPSDKAHGPNFYGRSQQLALLRSQRWTWICGRRTMGKSSLLDREARRSEQQDGWLALSYTTHKLPRGEETLADAFFKDFKDRALGDDIDEREVPFCACRARFHQEDAASCDQQETAGSRQVQETGVEAPGEVRRRGRLD